MAAPTARKRWCDACEAWRRGASDDTCVDCGSPLNAGPPGGVLPTSAPGPNLRTPVWVCGTCATIRPDGRQRPECECPRPFWRLQIREGGKPSDVEVDERTAALVVGFGGRVDPSLGTWVPPETDAFVKLVGAYARLSREIDLGEGEWSIGALEDGRAALADLHELGYGAGPNQLERWASGTREPPRPIVVVACTMLRTTLDHLEADDELDETQLGDFRAAMRALRLWWRTDTRTDTEVC